MSSLLEREAKNCLNCNAQVHGRFCHVCGQENIEPREGFVTMLTHFVYDLFHFDGKFFTTMKSLLFKPGFLTQEHLRGRRADYLHPIRLYIFTSAFFFLFFFMFNSSKVNETSGVEIKMDSSKNELIKLDKNYTSLVEYDSLQAQLPKAEKDGWLLRAITRKNLTLRAQYPNDQILLKKILDVFIHQFPKMLFVSLPLFALILHLLYIRKRQYYYADHVVFALHLYTTTFIIIFIVMCLNMLFGAIGWYRYDKLKSINYLDGFISPAFYGWVLLLYGYKSMRHFYLQSRKKTLVKYSLLLFINSLLFAVLFLIFILLSFLII